MEAFERKWGEYNTFNDLDHINNASEIEIWHAIDNLEENIMWSVHNNASKRKFGDDVPYELIVKARYNLDFLIYFTRKFGVEFDVEPSMLHRMERSESYKSWFSFWKELVASGAKDEDLVNVSWKDSIQKK